MENFFWLTIGDWSKDGHGQSKRFIISANKDVHAIRQAYKDSCRLTGLQFNDDENYIDDDEQDHLDEARLICVEYHHNSLTAFQRETLDKFNCPFVAWDLGAKKLAKLIMGFMSLSLSDFQYKFVKTKGINPVEDINGYWNPELNVQFGYGVFRIKAKKAKRKRP